MLNIADLKPGMIVSVRDPWTFYPCCLVVQSIGTLRFVPMDDYQERSFCPDDVVEVVE